MGLRPAFADSQDGPGLDAFSRAISAYQAGDWNAAAGLVDDALQAGLSKELTARALHLRAHIMERSGALARALQDYSTALWMDALPVDERKEALEGKRRVIAAMGLNTPSTDSKQASAPAQPAPQGSSGGFLSMFDGVFGSSKRAPPPPPPPPPAPPPVTQEAAMSSASGVERRHREAHAQPAKAVPAQKAGRKKKPPVQQPVRIASFQPSAQSASNGFMIVFGSVGSEAAGRSRAHQIKAALADILVNRNLEVEGSNGGFRIVAGPYKAKSAALALCSAMKQRGVACQVTQ